MEQQHWKELLAIDRYIVKSSSILQDLDRKILTLLYQPLIGSKGFSLYMTLWGELEQNRLWGVDSTHHSLMTTMQSNLREIYQERLKLEGLGLLKSYMKETDEIKSYLYELQAPLRPDEFFQDGVLNIYLYNRVGKTKYLQLKEFFSDEKIDKDMKDITRSFNDIFDSNQSANMIAKINKETLNDLTLSTEREFMQTEKRASIEIADDVFNFDLFFSGLSESIIPTRAITASVKEVIKKLSYLYGIDAVEMKNVLMNSINQYDEIDIEQLRKSARDWYQFKYGDELPALLDKVQPLPLRTVDETKTRTQEEEMIYQLETISPRQFLTDVSGGLNPSVGDLQIIEEVMLQQKLQPGVVNVLIYYVMLKTDMKLTKAYVQKIASHWVRKQITTVRAAMELAKNEHRQYQQWAEEKTNKKQTNYKKKPIRKEMLPAWLSEDDSITEQKEPADTKEATSSQIEQEKFEAEKRKLLDRIKKYKDTNNTQN
ncbi:replication initiation and membrane attachment family protein [Metabacillus malikii]|nr:DnaD domain protein [Metabacillus malikii]